MEHNAEGMAEFISHGGKARWITSPILDEKDLEVFRKITEEEREAYLGRLIDFSVEKLQYEMKKDARNLLAWMIHDGVLEMRFAVPVGQLEGGDFHDKFGSFYGENNNIVAFTSSINDSQKGFVNYEGIMVFSTWMGTKAYVDVVTNKFKKIWNHQDANLNCYRMTDAVKNKIFQLRTSERPYNLSKVQKDRWRHQDEAMECFLKNKNGILEMATGTGKTFTAIKIAKHMIDTGKVKRVVVCTFGNDLLEQWHKEILLHMENVAVFRYYESIYKDLAQFLLYKKPGVMILTLDAKRVKDTIQRLNRRDMQAKETTLWIFDEVHRLGANSLRQSLSGMIQSFQYRLGLSATPLREFDEAGNQFIREEVGKVIFRFDLKDAIEKGILCEFNYIPMEYELTDEEKRKKRDIIAKYEVKKARGEFVDDTAMYRDLAMVNKTSMSKLLLFRKLISEKTELLNRCIIFVETMEYGEEVQRILNDYVYKYHTYYADDQKNELTRFSRGEIQCLLTCKKISEGVDIKSVKNIFLFSSDRGKLVTTQRIGRSLRINSEEPDKKANIVDFICLSTKNNEIEEIQADKERKEWLEDLAETRRKE